MAGIGRQLETYVTVYLGYPTASSSYGPSARDKSFFMKLYLGEVLDLLQIKVTLIIL